MHSDGVKYRYFGYILLCILFLTLVGLIALTVSQGLSVSVTLLACVLIGVATTTLTPTFLSVQFIPFPRFGDSPLWNRDG